MNSIHIALNQFLSEGFVSAWGAADLRKIPPLGREYPLALSLLLAYGSPADPTDEEGFFHILEAVRSNLDRIVSETSRFLGRRNIPHVVVPQGGQDPITLEAAFSHKSAAVLAGLGWIGKNCLLVTPEYGPRVRIASILIGCELLPGVPMTESLCGACDACVSACPGGFITGLTWKPGTHRERLLDAHGCNDFRENRPPLLGRKSECGRCLLVCPHGR